MEQHQCLRTSFPPSFFLFSSYCLCFLSSSSFVNLFPFQASSSFSFFWLSFFLFLLSYFYFLNFLSPLSIIKLMHFYIIKFLIKYICLVDHLLLQEKKKMIPTKTKWSQIDLELFPKLFLFWLTYLKRKLPVRERTFLTSKRTSF